jgi:hypothetical protein
LFFGRPEVIAVLPSTFSRSPFQRGFIAHVQKWSNKYTHLIHYYTAKNWKWDQFYLKKYSEIGFETKTVEISISR